MSKSIRILLIGYLVLIAGCVTWYQAEQVTTTTVHKIESELAADFCTKLLGGMMRGCAVRITNTSTGVSNCVTFSMPGDLYAVRHEVGGHCMGQDHP